MANKIPVGQTLARSYGFAFGNIVNNFGATWIPVVMACVASLLLTRMMMDMLPALAPQDPAATLRMMPYVFGFDLLIFVFVAAIFAALTKEALGLRTGSPWLQLPFGPGTWRLLLGYVLLFVAAFVLAFIGAIIFVILGVVLSFASGDVMTRSLLMGLMGFVASCAFIYVFVRLSFLIAPVAVAEQKGMLRRSWQLTRGNFWRIVALALATLLPFFVLEFVLFYFVFGIDFLPHLPPIGAGPEALRAFQEQQAARSIQMMQRLTGYWYVLYPFGLVVGAFFNGLLAGLSAFSYRALTSESAEEPPAAA